MGLPRHRRVTGASACRSGKRRIAERHDDRSLQLRRPSLSEIISHAIWLHFGFPLGLRYVKDPSAGRRVSRLNDASRRLAG